MVSSRDPATAEFLGVEYKFHGAWLSYYKDYGFEPGITSRFVFNPQQDIKLDRHPPRRLCRGRFARGIPYWWAHRNLQYK